MSIKGFKAKDGTKHQYDYEALTNKPGNAGLYYTPVVTQPSDSTMQIAFEPSVSGAPTPDPVVVELPVGSGGSGENVNGGMSEAAVVLLKGILESAVYESDQSGNIALLVEELMENTSAPGESGDPTVPVEEIELIYESSGKKFGTSGSFQETQKAHISAVLELKQGSTYKISDNGISGGYAEITIFKESSYDDADAITQDGQLRETYSLTPSNPDDARLGKNYSASEYLTFVADSDKYVRVQVFFSGNKTGPEVFAMLKMERMG